MEGFEKSVDVQSAGIHFLTTAKSRFLCAAAAVALQAEAAKVAAHPQIDGDSRRATGRLSGRPFAPPVQSEVRMLQGQILGEYRLVAQKKTAHRTPWTKEDERQLKAYSRARTPLPEIAKKMRRTERALRRKAGILGIGLGHRR